MRFECSAELLEALPCYTLNMLYVHEKICFLSIECLQATAAIRVCTAFRCSCELDVRVRVGAAGRDGDSVFGSDVKVTRNPRCVEVFWHAVVIFKVTFAVSTVGRRLLNP